MAGEPFATGVIALVTPDGLARRVADGLAFPNGMLVTADNATLIVAEPAWRERLERQVGHVADADDLDGGERCRRGSEDGREADQGVARDQHLVGAVRRFAVQTLIADASALLSL